MECRHDSRICLNQHEIIRKYRCYDCGAVMMCTCDETYGRKFLPHQLKSGADFHTQQRVKVTAGFQQSLCNTCRGLSEEAAPKASLRGASSNIRRYYWREISMETTRRFATWAETQSIDYRRARHLHADQHASIERDVVEEIKRLHATAPKYDYANRPSAAVISANQVEVIDLHATFVKIASGRAQILDGSAICSAEDYVARYFLRLGYDVMPMESRPLHALFAVFMWLLIEDPADECGRIVGFGSRSAFERGERGEIIYTSLPEDFGAPGYGERRATAIAEHLASIPDVRSEWQWTFDYWITGSKRLREYLWAHKPEDLERARLLVDLLPLQALRRILQYLVDSYWARYLGWPDLLVSNSQGEFFFVEVKASADPLSDEQKNWISANTRDLRLPFKIAKIHRDKIVEALTL